MGVISACLPSLRPGLSILLRGSTKGLGVKKKGNGSGPDGSPRIWRSRTRDDDREGIFQRLDEPIDWNRRQWGYVSAVRGGQSTGRSENTDEISLQEMNAPARGIRVQKEVVVTSSDWLEYKDKVF